LSRAPDSATNCPLLDEPVSARGECRGYHAARDRHRHSAQRQIDHSQEPVHSVAVYICAVLLHYAVEWRFLPTRRPAAVVQRCPADRMEKLYDTAVAVFSYDGRRRGREADQNSGFINVLFHSPAG